jgi:hypothetical protein
VSQKNDWKPVGNAVGNVIGHQTSDGRFVPGSSPPKGDGAHHNEQRRDPSFEQYKRSQGESGTRGGPGPK